MEETFICDIESVGAAIIGGGRKAKPTILVRLTHDDAAPAFTDAEFQMDKKAGKEMLATALTAVSNGFQVDIVTDLDPLTFDPSSGLPVIKEIHLLVIP